MAPIAYRSIDIGEIELIRELWTGLNELHRDRARLFRNSYDRMTFESRKEYFERKAAEGALTIILAYDPDAMRYIGYAVCSLSIEKNREIESLFVDENHRCRGVGRALMTRALSWLEAGGSERNRYRSPTGTRTLLDSTRNSDFSRG